MSVIDSKNALLEESKKVRKWHIRCIEEFRHIRRYDSIEYYSDWGCEFLPSLGGSKDSSQSIEYLHVILLVYELFIHYPFAVKEANDCSLSLLIYSVFGWTSRQPLLALSFYFWIVLKEPAIVAFYYTIELHWVSFNLFYPLLCSGPSFVFVVYCEVLQYYFCAIFFRGQKYSWNFSDDFTV